VPTRVERRGAVGAAAWSVAGTAGGVGGACGRVEQGRVPGGGARDSAQAPVGVGGQDRDERALDAVAVLWGQW